MKKENDDFFEANFLIINQEIAKRRVRWNLKIIPWMDFEDVSQIVRFHIYKKIHLYDRKKPILPWVNRIISNQIKNLIRDYYGNFSRPCLKCAAFEGGDNCSIYVKQCGDCPLYRKWEKSKKSAHDTKLPVSVENHIQEVHQKSAEDVDVELGLSKLKDQVKNFLKPVEYKVFISLYVDNNSEEKTAHLLGYQQGDRNTGAKNVKLINKNLILKIKTNIYNGSIDI